MTPLLKAIKASTPTFFNHEMGYSFECIGFEKWPRGQNNKIGRIYRMHVLQGNEKPSAHNLLKVGKAKAWNSRFAHYKVSFLERQWGHDRGLRNLYNYIQENMLTLVNNPLRIVFVEDETYYRKDLDQAEMETKQRWTKKGADFSWDKTIHKGKD